MGGFLSWWDGVELWLSGLPFVAQSVVVIPVVLALAYAVAVVLDAVLDRGIQLQQRLRRSPDEAAGDTEGSDR
ncbi:hypothetical protein EV589_5624 [Mycobacterium sp. BK558]|uniref:Uncharacterized protein n=1 Tax=Mycolicibacterium chubuense TaxID=1800 RepID=A0A0J6W757_MYCCU|nr:hypothetical protein MCHUDSM44219_03329 [Mycolicibacterium chubuense]ORA54278.1 hypothetical protein BST22_06550 [Mycolicibacterium chubuense]RZT12456.1 hypothetical protein EV589_5624 [Mycobacterium sp. BK558]SPX96751.1 Conserved membrane protein of uncharacterised function [Mycolicibacterium chubuense]